MKEVSWKHVVLIVVFMETLAVLSFTGRDTASYTMIGLGVLGALGLIVQQSAQTKEQTAVVKEQTNGNTSRMLDILEAQGKMLAAMQPIQLPTAPADAADWTPPKDEP